MYIIVKKNTTLYWVFIYMFFILHDQIGVLEVCEKKKTTQAFLTVDEWFKKKNWSIMP